MRAQMMIADSAICACATPDCEIHRDFVSFGEIGCGVARSDHDAGRLVTADAVSRGFTSDYSVTVVKRKV